MKSRKASPAARTRSGTKTEDAYEVLKHAIVRGVLPEGTFLSESEILEKFTIGRTPFREACNRLHHERLLEVVPRRGYLVTELTFRDVRDLFEARLLLETMAVQLAAERAVPEQLEALEEILERGRTLTEPDAADRLIHINADFHLCVARMTQNRELARAISAILDKGQRLAHIEHRLHRYQPVAFERTHRPIVDAIRHRDGAAARTALVEDIGDAQGVVLGEYFHALPVVEGARQAAGEAIRRRDEAIVAVNADG